MRGRLNDGDSFLVSTFSLKLNGAVDQGEEGIILGMPDVFAGVNIRSALANDNGTCRHTLPAIGLHSHPLTVRVPAVLG
jgi:hypothetical protein